MPPLLVYILLALVAGACLPTQAGINAQLNRWTLSPVWTAAISFAVGTAALIGYGLLTRGPLTLQGLFSEAPWWVWTGGFLGAFFVAATVVLAPALGAAAMVALIIAGQMLVSLGLDHFGLLGYQTHPLNVWRLIGAGLIVAGVVLIRRF
ncbi:MAG: DMT family transporter [Desulfobacterales bacterium]|jgi:transporter family-2 protein